jgi:hypothetical protein
MGLHYFALESPCILCICLLNVASVAIRVTHEATGCPTRYRTRHFVNNFTTNEDIATKFLSGLTSLFKKCERKERTPVQISLQYFHLC